MAGGARISHPQQEPTTPVTRPSQLISEYLNFEIYQMESSLLVPILFEVIWQLQLMIPTNPIHYIAHTAKNRNVPITAGI